jgi:predicted ATPase
MIQAIEFENYRIFATPQHLRLAPITVIFGKNNSGKSAVLKLPLLIESALAMRNGEVFAKSFHELALCNERRDVVYGKANKAVKITLHSDMGDVLTFSFFVDAMQKDRETHLESWTLTTSVGNTLSVQLDDQNRLCDEDGNEVAFSGIRPQVKDKYPWMDEALSRFSSQVEYLGPIREAPARDYRLHDNHEDYVGPKGECAYDFLIEDLVKKEGKLLEKVSAWYEHNFDGWKIAVDQSNAPVYYIEMQYGNLRNNILDTGTGIVQSLPVLISVARETEGPRLWIGEETETHMHPDAHAEMAGFMAHEVMEDSDKRLLVETHSSNLILRLRRMVAEKTLRKEDVALYYVEFDADKSSSALHAVDINEDGSVSDWPSGVFGESYQETVKLRLAQLKNYNDEHRDR